MRKLLVLFLFTGEIFALFYPGEIGFRTLSPTLSNLNFTLVGGRVAPGKASTSFAMFDNYFGLNYPLTKNASLYFGASVLVDKTEDSTLYGFGDLEIGLKLSILDRENLAIGLYPLLHPAIRESKIGGVRYFSSGSFDYGLLLLLGMRYGDFSIYGNIGGVNWLNNPGYSYFCDQILFRLALLKSFKRFEPFLEFSYDWFIFQSLTIGPLKRDTGRVYGGSPGRISAGSHIKLGDGWRLSLGGTFYWSRRKINGALPESTFVLASGDIIYEFALGLSYSFSSQEKNGKICVKGNVVDAVSGEGIPAEIYVEGADLYLKTSPSGEFFLEKLSPGIYRIFLKAPGYLEERKVIAVLSDGEIEYTFFMKKKRERKGWIHIRLQDIEGNPIEAEIFVDGKPMRTDPDGFLLLSIEPGLHKITTEPYGYKKLEKEILVKEDTLTLSLRISPIDIFPVLYFPHDSYELPDNEIDLLKEVADYLLENPKIKIEIVGYASSDGPEDYNRILSEKRAESVKEILVSIFGVDSKRLKTLGEGEKNPVVSNETPEGRAKNRRVVFRIIPH